MWRYGAIGLGGVIGLVLGIFIITLPDFQCAEFWKVVIVIVLMAIGGKVANEYADI